MSDKKMKRYKIGRWRIIVYGDGVIEFSGPTRTLGLYPAMSEDECHATFDALPEYVFDRFMRLISNGAIE